MKILIVLLCLVAAAAAGAIGAMLVAPPAPPPTVSAQPTPSAAPLDAAAAPTPAPLADFELDARVAALTHELEALRAEVERLAKGSSRKAAIEPAEIGAGSASVSEFVREHRDGILQVIEDDRLARDVQREEVRVQRENELTLARAERIARELGLDAAQQQSLADVLLTERAKLQEMRGRLRDEPAANREFESFRDEVRGIRDWSFEELTARFGSDLAAKIDAFESDRRGGGWRGPNSGQSANAGEPR